MSIVIPSLDYGTVIGRFLIELADSSDADLKPDVYPAQGYVVFTPGTSFASVNDAVPDPAIIFPQKVVGVLDSQGYLCTANFDAINNTYARTTDGEYIPTRRGVSLQATDDTSLNPHSWSWRADFFFKYHGTAISFPGFNFSLPTNQEVDLTLAVPIETAPGEYTIVGPKGPRGEKGDVGDTNSLSVGTVNTVGAGQPASVNITGTPPNQVLNFILPSGPVGPSGGPIPAGGTDGDTVLKSSGGASEWRFTDGVQDNLFPNGTLEYRNSYRWDSVMTYSSSDTPPGYPTSVWCPPGRVASTPVLINDLTPIVPGDEYILEMWIKADKPNSIFYLELRDQNGSHAGIWNWIGNETNPANAYPVGKYTVPTEWTKVKSRGTLNADVTSIRVSSWYFNHSAGSERGASIGVSGFRVYRAPSTETLSSSIESRLPSASEKDILGAATASNTNGALVKRDSTGGFASSYVSVAQTTPSADTHLTSKRFVEDRISTETRVDLFSNVRKPLIVSHRGGAHLYPEESMEGFIASMESGYAPEMDVQFLSDGTPVCCHDATVNRTMTGVSGNVSSLTQEQWRKARIKPVYKGGNSAKPVFFEDVLDRLGGRILLVPEIKTGATNAQIDTVIDMVKKKRLENAVLLQSFTYASCQRIANAGLKVAYLFTATLPTQSPATIKNAGIEFVGPSHTMSNSNINTFISAGLKTVPYTVNTPRQVSALPTGIYGYFTDDPWSVSEEHQTRGVAQWTKGDGWPYRRNTHAIDGAPGTILDASSEFEIFGGGIHIPPKANRGIMHIGLEHLTGGMIDRPCVLSARFVYGRRATSQTVNAGFTLYKNVFNQDAPFRDTATSGQEGYTIAMRRNGQGQIWAYENGASASSLLQTNGMGPVIPPGSPGTMTVRVELTETKITMFVAETNQVMSVNHSITGPFIPMLRCTSMEATAYDVHVGELSAPTIA